MTMGHSGIFGNPASTGSSNRGGLFGASAAMPKKKPSFFGEGGAGRNIAGYIGDALLQMSGMQPVYNPAMQDRQRMAFLTQQRAQDRMMDREDWEWKEGYKATHPDAPQPTELERYMAAAGIDPQSPEGMAMFKAAAQNKADPPVWRQGSDLRWYRVDTVQPPSGPVGELQDYTPGTPMGATDQYGNAPQLADQAARMRAQLVERWGPVRGESEFQKWLQAFGGGR